MNQYSKIIVYFLLAALFLPGCATGSGILIETDRHLQIPN